MGVPDPTTGMTRMRSRLAGHAIDLEFEPEAAHLADAFARQVDADREPAGLTVSFRVDKRFVDSALRTMVGDSSHQRRGNTHVWLAAKPRHVQLLSPDPVSGRDAAVASVLLEQGHGLDGSLRARPGVEVISAWAIGRDVLPVHASGIALGDRALILLGESGSGKTTTALALAERGWNLLADDRCFVYRHGPEVKAASLYATAIVTETSLSRLEARNWRDLGVTHHGKQARHLPSTIQIAAEAHLASVVWISPDAGSLYNPVPLSRREALVPWQSALAPTLQAHGPSAGWLRNLADLSHAVPAWRMRVSWDFDRLDGALRELVARGGPTT